MNFNPEEMKKVATENKRLREALNIAFLTMQHVRPMIKEDEAKEDIDRAIHAVQRTVDEAQERANE